MTDDDKTPRVETDGDVTQRINSRKCAARDCTNVIIAGVGAPMFCEECKDREP